MKLKKRLYSQEEREWSKADHIQFNQPYRKKQTDYNKATFTDMLDEAEMMLLGFTPFGEI